MDFATIQAEVDSLIPLMLAKVVLRPCAEVHIASGQQPGVLLRFGKAESSWDCDVVWLPGADIAAAISAARNHIASLPNPEERHRNEFIRLTGVAAEYGKAHGIGDEFVNPLILQMKALSENAIAAE